MKKNDLTKGLFAALLLASPMAGAEPQYPAKHFEPEIIYQDSDLIAKHAKAAKERALTEQVAAVDANNAANAAAGTKSASPVTENYPIGLIVLALAGFIFWNSKRPGSKAQEVPGDSTVASKGAPGETGVAKYLKDLNPPSGVTVAETGVAKYLKSLPSKVAAAETGVARYLKNLPSKAAAAETGVAKYLKNRDMSAR